MTREQLATLLGDEKTTRSELDVLNDREVEVISLFSQGANSSHIRQELQLTKEELTEIKRAIMAKCKLKDEVQLIQFAARQKR